MESLLRGSGVFDRCLAVGRCGCPAQPLASGLPRGPQAPGGARVGEPEPELEGRAQASSPAALVPIHLPASLTVCWVSDGTVSVPAPDSSAYTFQDTGLWEGCDLEHVSRPQEDDEGRRPQDAVPDGQPLRYFRALQARAGAVPKARTCVCGQRAQAVRR